jgi:hypothetical protein
MHWISIKDKLPDLEDGHSDSILIFDGEKVIDNVRFIPFWGGFISNPYSDVYADTLKNVTHWMYLPKPPVVKEK